MVLWHVNYGFMPIVFLNSMPRHILYASHSHIIKTNFTSEKLRGRPKQVYVIDTGKPLISNVFKLWKNRLESQWLHEIWWNFAWSKNNGFELLFKNENCIQNQCWSIKQPCVDVVHKQLVNGWASERVTSFILLRFICVYVRIYAIIWVAKFRNGPTEQH